MSSSYQQLLTELAQHIGLDGPSLLAQQEIDIDGLSIFLQPSGEEEAQELRLCSVLAPLPQQRIAQVACTLLQANHLWVGTGGGTLGLSPAGDMVTWCVCLPLQDLDAATLAVLLADFARLGLAWVQYLEADAGAAQELQIPQSTMLFTMHA